MVGTKPAGRCIFCGGFKMSKEHIWSDWLTKRGIIPAGESHYQNAIVYDVDITKNTATFKYPKMAIKQGSSAQKKIRKVCKTCNSGWMSGIVDKSISIAEPIINADTVDLDRPSQTTLAAWIALACIMAEYTEEETRVISDFERQFLFKEFKPSNNWLIFIGRHNGADWLPTRYRHRVFKAFNDDPTNNPLILPVYSGQITTYTIQNLAIQAFTATHEILLDIFKEDFSPVGMHQIWPPVDNCSWPPTHVLPSEQLWASADAFASAITLRR